MPAPTPTTTADRPDSPRELPAVALPALPSLARQAERLVTLGVADLAGLTPDDLRVLAHDADASTPGTAAGADPASPDVTRSHLTTSHRLLVVPPALVPVSVLAPLMRRGERAGFVVEDMTDVDAFAPIPGVDVPDAPYVLDGPDRGDDLAGWSPDEAGVELARRGRTPLTLAEGVQWVLQAPDVLERKRCFMTIGSRVAKARGGRDGGGRARGGLDARTPAVWISNGTGRDGRERRDAPKVGWCWAGNRHTWLGFASARSRVALTR